MFASLEDIRGIGGKVRERLLAYYGSESEALRSLENEEFERLLEAGISFPKAAEIARNVWSAKRGFSYADMLKTGEIKDVFNRILDVLKGYPKTDFARIGVGLFYPTTDEGEIKRRLEYVRDCASLAEALREKKAELEPLLSGVTTLKEGEPRVEDTIAVEDRELYETLLQRFRGKVHILHIESPEDLEYLRDFEFVRYIQRNARFSDQAHTLQQVEPVYEEDPESLLPEDVLSFFGRNKECIISAVRTVGLSGDSELKAGIEKLSGEMDAIEAIDAGGCVKGLNKEFTNLDSALENLEEEAQRFLEKANKAISEKTAAMSLKGDEVLGLLRSTGTSGAFQGLPKEFLDTILSTAGEFEEKLAESLGIGAEWTRGIFSGDSFPLEIDPERIAETKSQLLADKKRLEFETKRGLAKRLAGHIQIVKKIVRKAMELDLRLSLGQFAIDHNITVTEIQRETGAGFRQGMNIHLKGKEIQPVDYTLGSCTLFPKNRERAAVITGANSGGKTTLLELMAQTVLMTHMGLGAPAKTASTSIFDEIYYFGKGQGTDAGAFESLLKSFEEIASSSEKRLILADEIEAITEPGAAAKILSAILDWFKGDENTLIAVVTHLGEDIAEHAGSGIRIDGIEAKGLDKDLNLIVNRNPVMGMVAKSTPELIVERLSKTSAKKDFYKRILERF